MRYCLKFPEKPENADDLKDCDGVFIDVIGEIEGKDGWHLNIICDNLPVELAEFEVFPENPYRVWL